MIAKPINAHESVAGRMANRVEDAKLEAFAKAARPVGSPMTPAGTVGTVVALAIYVCTNGTWKV